MQQETVLFYSYIIIIIKLLQQLSLHSVYCGSHLG